MAGTDAAFPHDALGTGDEGGVNKRLYVATELLKGLLSRYGPAVSSGERTGLATAAQEHADSLIAQMEATD